jgi:pantoate kinase
MRTIVKQRHRKKVDRPQDRMLADFLRAPTAEQKREVIERFAPLYFAVTPKENQDERLQASS